LKYLKLLSHVLNTDFLILVLDEKGALSAALMLWKLCYPVTLSAPMYA